MLMRSANCCSRLTTRQRSGHLTAATSSTPQSPCGSCYTGFRQCVTPGRANCWPANGRGSSQSQTASSSQPSGRRVIHGRQCGTAFKMIDSARQWSHSAGQDGQGQSAEDLRYSHLDAVRPVQGGGQGTTRDRSRAGSWRMNQRDYVVTFGCGPFVPKPSSGAGLAGTVVCLTWKRPSVSVCWRPLVAVAIVTHLVTQPLRTRDGP